MKALDLLIKILIDDATTRRVEEDRKALIGFKGLLTVFRGHFHHFTLYNLMGLIAGIGFAVSLFYPWWYADAYNRYSTILAYPIILRHDLPPDGLKFVIETPIVAVVLLILTLTEILFLVFWGSTMAGRKGRLFLLCSGLFMLLYTAGFYCALLYATHRVDVPVTGSAVIDYTMPIDVDMQFLAHYYAAIISGIVCMASALSHGFITIKFYRNPRVDGHGL